MAGSSQMTAPPDATDPIPMLWLLRALTNVCVHTLIKTHTHTHINKLLLRNQNRHSPRKCMLDLSGQGDNTELQNMQTHYSLWDVGGGL